MELMKQIEDNSIDFVLTDPPFNVGLEYAENFDDSLKDEEYSDWCFRWISQIERVLKNGRYAVIFTGDKKLFYVMKAIYRTGLIFHHFLKWNKPICQRSLSGTVLFNRTELAFVLSKGKPDLSHIKRTVLFSDTLIYNNTTPNDKFESTIHNAMRPIPLYKHIIEGFGGDIILDCFMGSGTTALACKQLDKSYIGIELNPDYVNLSNNRIESFMKQVKFNDLF